MNYKQMCIQQGYVPTDCKLEGLLVWLLINEGRNPCEGCSVNCMHSRCSECEKKNKYINEAEIEHKERLEKRNVLGTNSKPIVYVDADYNDVHITTIDPSSERGYHLCCKNFDEAASYIPMC